MSKLNRLELERLRYWQGQTLRSVDFRDQLAIDAQLRWWHNRALHNTFGIAKRFEVELINSNQSVKIHQGLAYDCFGRELIHAVDTRLPIPTEEAGKDVTLLVRFKNDKHRATHEVGSVFPFEKAPGANQIEFFWRPTDTVDIQDGVPLARLKKGGTSNSERSLLRPVVRSRPLARPRMASGATIPGNTAWEIWEEVLNGNPIPVGVQVTIDTSAAGFTEVPCYFAWLQRQPENSSKPAFFVYSEHIDNSSMNSFTFRLLPRLLNGGPQDLAAVVNRGDEAQVLKLIREQVSVCWLGIQAESAQKFLASEVNHGID
jgi:hypothetical protein